MNSRKHSNVNLINSDIYIISNNRQFEFFKYKMAFFHAYDSTIIYTYIQNVNILVVRTNIISH